MDKLNRMVIDLYRDSFADYKNQHQVNHNRVLDVKKSIANAITRAKVLNEPICELEALMSDVDYLKYNLA